jgi:hypothetical protein
LDRRPALAPPPQPPVFASGRSVVALLVRLPVPEPLVAPLRVALMVEATTALEQRRSLSNP